MCDGGWGQEEGRGKEEEFPISSPVTHGLPPFLFYLLLLLISS